MVIRVHLTLCMNQFIVVESSPRLHEENLIEGYKSELRRQIDDLVAPAYLTDVKEFGTKFHALINHVNQLPAEVMEKLCESVLKHDEILGIYAHTESYEDESVELVPLDCHDHYKGKITVTCGDMMVSNIESLEISSLTREQRVYLAVLAHLKNKINGPLGCTPKPQVHFAIHEQPRIDAATSCLLGQDKILQSFKITMGLEIANLLIISIKKLLTNWRMQFLLI